MHVKHCKLLLIQGSMKSNIDRATLWQITKAKLHRPISAYWPRTCEWTERKQEMKIKERREGQSQQTKLTISVGLHVKSKWTA